MARGRMLNQSYAEDRLLAELVDEHGADAALVYFGLIPFQDREGRVHGDPHVLKGRCWPRSKHITAEVIKRGLEACDAKQLLIWYEVDGDRWVCFPNFRKNQPRAQLDRESESTIPEPPKERIEQWRKPRMQTLASTVVHAGTDMQLHEDACNDMQLSAEEKRREVEEKGREENQYVELALDGVSSGPDDRSRRIQTVWGKYREYHPSCPAALRQGRKEYRLARDRLDDFTVEQLHKAIDGYHRSPFHNGVNDRGAKYLGFELIMRDVDHVNKGIEMADDPTLTQGLSEKTRKTVNAMAAWAKRQT